MANDTSRLQGASSPLPVNSLRDVALRSERAEDTGNGVDGLFRQTFDSQREQWTSRQQAPQMPSRDASADNRKAVAARRQDAAARDMSDSRAQAAAGKKTPRAEPMARKPVAKNAGRQASPDNEHRSAGQAENSAAKSVESRTARPRAETVREAGRADAGSAIPDENRVTAGATEVTSCPPKPSDSDIQAGGVADAGRDMTGAGVTGAITTSGDTATSDPEVADTTLVGSLVANPGDVDAGGDLGAATSPDELSTVANVTANPAATAALASGGAVSDMTALATTTAPAGNESHNATRLQQVSDLMRAMQPVEEGDQSSSLDGLQHILARLEQVKSTILSDQVLPGMSDAQEEALTTEAVATLPVEGGETPLTPDNLLPEELTVTLSELADESAARAFEKQTALAADALPGHQASGGIASQHAFFRANSLMASSMQLQWVQPSGSAGEKASAISGDLTSAATPGTTTAVDTEFQMQFQSGAQQGGGEGESPDAQTQEQVRLAQWQARSGESLGKIGSEVESAFGRIGSARESRGSDNGSSPIVTDVRSLMMQRDAEVRQLQAATPAAQGDPLVPGRAGFAQAMGERIMMLMTQKVTAADIVLDPRELGPVEVKIRQDKDQTTLMFASHHPAVREQLEASLPKLRDLFSQAGLSLGNVSVGDRQAGGNSSNQGGQERWQGAESQDVLDGVQPTAASRKPRNERAVDFYA